VLSELQELFSGKKKMSDADRVSVEDLGIYLVEV